MFFFRAVCAFAAVTAALANPLVPRQAGNTNAQISAVLDGLSMKTRNHIFFINTLQANHTASDSSVDPVIQQMVTEYNDAASTLNTIPVSTGSTTEQPTNIEISRLFGETLQNLGTGLSGLQAQGSVPNFGASVGQLDPAVAGVTNALTQVSPGSLRRRFRLLDVSQFFRAQGVWPETLNATGF